MKIKIEKDRTVIEKPSNKKKVVAVVLAVLVACAGVVVYRCNTAVAFPKGTLVNGVDVGGMTAEESKDAVLKGMNHIQVKIDEDEPVEIKTKYTYNIEDTLENKIKIASIDPRRLNGPVGYKVPLTVSKGIQKTAKAIKKAIPTKKGVVETKDAYITYDKLDIVVEVYGKSLDYEMLAEKIAEEKADDPSKTLFEFASEDYIAMPKVHAKDLQAEYEFYRDTIGQGLTMTVQDGGSWNLKCKDLKPAVVWTDRGGEFSEKGAKKIAKKIKKEFSRDYIVVETQEGNKQVTNYVLTDEVDVNKTAESILEAIKNQEVGKVYLKKSSRGDLKTRVEVSIKSQTCYFIKDGKVKLKTPVVTGNATSAETATPTGIFKMYYKERDVVLRGPNGDGTDYASPVSFWMPFNGGIGLHDATWRSSFGGTIYRGGGSHGCVNMPYDQAAKLYELVDAGTVVVVY